MKWAVTGLFAFFVLGGAFSNQSETRETIDTTKVPQMSTEAKASPTPIVTPAPTEKLNIVVTSQIIKKVDKKYRYFFDIRNRDTKNFEGSVSIKLLTDKSQSSLAGDTFTTKAPIEPGLGTSVYADANTGPTSEHGEYGMTRYKYIVKVNGVEVNSGEERLTNKFEDTDLYGF